jgi:hypothetical protein
VSFRITDSATLSAWLAAGSQRAQLEVLVSALGATPTARYFAGGTLLRTQTLPALTIDNSDTPYSITLGLSLADTHVATGTPTKLVLRAGSTDVVEMSCSVSGGVGDADFAGAIKVLCKPTLSGVTLLASDLLPVGDVFGNVEIAIWGQSNALGLALRSDTGTSPLSADPDLAAYNANTFTFDRVFIWDGANYEQLVMGTNNGARNANEFGVEFGLAVRWMRETASGNLYLIRQASGGVSITSFDPSPAALNWANGENELSQAASWLAGAGVTLAASHWIWIQGESDAAQTQSWYETRLQEIIDALHSEGHLTSPTSKLVLSQMHPSTATYGAGVAAAKAAIVAATPARIADPTFPYFHTGDNIHYSARSMVQHAYDCFEFLLDTAPLEI